MHKAKLDYQLQTDQTNHKTILKHAKKNVQTESFVTQSDFCDFCSAYYNR